jgi:hypothetical protein
MDRGYENEEAMKGTSELKRKELAIKFHIMVISFNRQVLGNEENMKNFIICIIQVCCYNNNNTNKVIYRAGRETGRFLNQNTWPKRQVSLPDPAGEVCSPKAGASLATDQLSTLPQRFRTKEFNYRKGINCPKTILPDTVGHAAPYPINIHRIRSEG